MRLKPDTPTEPVILRFRADAPRCGGGEVRPVLSEEPFPGALIRESPAVAQGMGTVRVRFRIDRSGRPLGIEAQIPATGFRLDASDVAPALATWRFRPGAERRNCELDFRIMAEPVARAAPETLYRYVSFQPLLGRSAPAEVGAAAFERLRPEGANCRPRPDLRVDASPPFERIPQAPGTLSYSFLTYDIDAAGAPRNVRLVSTAGNGMLDRESLRAVAAFRFAPGTARTGCTQYFFRRGEVSGAPLPPEPSAYRRPDATCPKERREWAYTPALVFPEPFNRRGIEGWAVVRYDQAPNGATRNVEAVDYFPARGFADEAVRIIAGARKIGDGRAYSGCIGRVVFELPKNGPPIPKGG
jgi:hypothetical protein